MPDFVNPYAFVPLPEMVERFEAPSQERLREATHSGRIKLLMTADTPISVGSSTLWASSVAGAVRSLHETLTASCLRVVDPDYVPVHRQPVQPDPRREALALVRSRSDHRIVLAAFGLQESIRVCTDALLDAVSNDPARIHTGARFNVHGPYVVSPDDGSRMYDGAGCVSFAPDGEYVLLVTDTQARTTGFRDGNGVWHRYRWWFRAVPAAGGDTIQIGQDHPVLANFEYALAGSHDLKTSQASQPALVPVVDHRLPEGAHGHPTLAYRRNAQNACDQDGVLWLRFRDAQTRTIETLTELRLARFWRGAGQGALADRARATIPCTTWKKACPSCRLLGLVDASGDGNDTGRIATQEAYRGRVRFADPRRLDDQPMQQLHRVLSSPHPGAGNFYLKNTHQNAYKRWTRTDDDGNRAREIAGRKQYWTNSWESRVNQPQPGNDNDATVSTLDAFRPGSRWEVTVTFEDLSESELGSLLATLAPHRLLENENVRFRLGGGKPYGLGSVVTSIDQVQLIDRSERWLNPIWKVATEEEVDRFIQHFRDEFETALGADGRSAIDHLLTKDYVDGSLVTYPAAVDGTPFTFWKDTKGVAVVPIPALPAASANPEAQRLRKPGGH